LLGPTCFVSQLPYTWTFENFKAALEAVGVNDQNLKALRIWGRRRGVEHSEAFVTKPKAPIKEIHQASNKM